MNDTETKVLLKLTRENAELQTFFNVLSARVEASTKRGNHYVDVDDIKPMMDAYNNSHKEIDVISFREEGDVSIKENG